MKLSNEQLSQFESDGYLVIPGFYTLDECQKLKGEIKQIITEGQAKGDTGSFFSAAVIDGGQNREKYFMESGDKIRFFYEEENNVLIGDRPLNKIGHALHYWNDVFAKYSLKHDGVRNILQSLSFVKPAICQSMYIFKREKVGSAVRPHTDGTFLMNTGNVVGLWIPLENATLTNGCLWFIPGSHKQPIISFFERTEESNFQTMELKNHQEVDESKFVPVEVEAGDLVLIDKAVMHKSEKNTSEHPRDAFTFHVVETYKSDWSKLNWLQPTGSPASFSVVYDESN